MTDLAAKELTFGCYVRARRRALDLTQEELARSVPCSRITIRRVEADELRPSKELAEVLADRLGVAPAQREDFVRFARGRGPALATSVPGVSEQRAFRHHLPAPLTRFVGRGAEIKRITGLLAGPDCRLLTLTGPGGTGKTRLALQAAAAVAHAFADGACFVPLGTLTDPDLVGPTIAQGMGLEVAAGRPVAGVLVAYLKDRHLLLVLDGFEGLLDAAPLVGELLAAAAGLKVLVTSRALLSLSAEHNFPVSPLPCPGPNDLEPAQLHSYPAVQLFVLRAAAMKPDFAIDDANSVAVAEICRRVDGLPLAIELAAVHMALLSPEALLARLEHRLPTLTGGPRDAPERQRTLRSTIAWSYQLLDEEEQRIFRRLAVFAGGWNLTAAEAVAISSVLPGSDSLEAMSSLAGKSLIQPKAGPSSAPPTNEPRFTMLDTIREYGLEQLEACGEAEAASGAHAAFYLRLAEAGEVGLKGREQTAWGRRLGAEQDNFRAALTWAIRAGETETVLRMAGALRMFWDRHGNWGEGSNWLERVLALPGGSSRARARALVAAATMQFARTNTAATLGWLKQGRTLAREARDQTTEAAALMLEGRVWAQHRDVAEGVALMEQALALARTVGDLWLNAWILFWLGWELNFAGIQPERSRATLGESLALFERCGDLLGKADSLAQLAAQDGLAAHSRAEYEAAMGRMDEAVALFHELDARAGLMRASSIMGDVARFHDDYARAHSAYHACEAVARSMGLPVGLSLANRGALALQEANLDEAARLLHEGWTGCVAEGKRGVLGFVIAMVGSLLAALGEPAAAATVLGCARAEFDRLGSDLQGPDLRVYERGLAAARDALSQPDFDAAWEHGRGLAPEGGYEFAVRYLTGEAVE